MKIAFLHYHIKPGGVTTVIRQQIEAIKKSCEVLVISGEPVDSSFPADTIHVPGTGYDRPGKKTPDPGLVANAVLDAILSKWSQGCDILHVHNPTLAKNKNFLKILKKIETSPKQPEKKIKLFLQIHDFAEDGRPQSYFFDPYLSNCHYGVINSRDYSILLKAGLKKKGLHKIFNTVTPPLNIKPGIKPERKIHDNRVLYPVRAIRRKNIGEAILLSLFFKAGDKLAITLPPNSPADIGSYENWKEFCAKHNLWVLFEAGLKNNFTELVQSSKFIITTSITEGFGFSFLEAWTAKKFLWGRKLPDICHDFEEKGIQLNHLYKKLLIPVEWIGKEEFFAIWKSTIIKNCRLFKYNIDNEKIKKHFLTITKNNVIDFGLIDEGFQKKVILRLLTEKKELETLKKINPFLSHPGNAPEMKKLISNNMNNVLKNYNEKKYRQKLLDVYSRINTCPVLHSIDKNALLDEFLNLNKFSLLKWREYAGK